MGVVIGYSRQRVIHLETMESEHDAPSQQAPRALNKVQTCRASDAVWRLTWCVQGKTGVRRQRNFEASDDNFTTLSQVLSSVMIPEKHLIRLGRRMPGRHKEEELQLNKSPPQGARAMQIGSQQRQHHR